MRYIDFGNPNYTIIYDTDDYRIFTSAPQAYSSARKFADLTFDALCLYEEQGADPFTDDVFVAIINDRGRSYYGVVMPTIAYRRMYEHINRPAT